jgi:ABC-type transport system involved in cytochrome c biogenesis permease subunit
MYGFRITQPKKKIIIFFFCALVFTPVPGVIWSADSENDIG